MMVQHREQFFLGYWRVVLTALKDRNEDVTEATDIKEYVFVTSMISKQKQGHENNDMR